MSDDNIIVVGAGEKDYWARVDDGIIADVLVVARNPRQFAGIDEDIIPKLMQSFPESSFVKLPEGDVRPGIGWGYDADTEQFTAPPPSDPSEGANGEPGVSVTPMDPNSAEFQELVHQIRETLKAEILAELSAGNS